MWVLQQAANVQRLWFAGLKCRKAGMGGAYPMLRRSLCTGFAIRHQACYRCTGMALQSSRGRLARQHAHPVSNPMDPNSRTQPIALAAYLHPWTSTSPGTGWSELRLLAPRAEVRLLLAGGSSLVDAGRLSYLGEALRAALVLQARSATLVR